MSEIDEKFTLVKTVQLDNDLFLEKTRKHYFFIWFINFENSSSIKELVLQTSLQIAMADIHQENKCLFMSEQLYHLANILTGRQRLS